VGDPLNEQGEIPPALRQVVEAAGPYLDGLPKRLVYDRAAEPLLEELGGPLPERGSGTRRRSSSCCASGRRPRPPRRGRGSTTS
jgi:hypothetical protein